MSGVTVPVFFHLKAAWQPESRTAEFNGTVYRADDLRPVSGQFADFVGRRFGLEDLFDRDFHEEEDRDVLSLVRAYAVPSVLDLTLVSEGEAQISEQIERLLGERCPGIDWRVGDRNLTGPLKKYGLLHTSVPAPPDVTAGQPMALELFAHISRLAGQEIGPGGVWYDCWRSERGESYADAPLHESLEFRIKAATYANMTHPGIGVDTYF